MPPIDFSTIPPEVAAWLQSQMGLLPDSRTYKGQQIYNEPDSGWMKDQLNYKQDLLGSMMDPSIGMMSGDGAYDPMAIAMANQKAEAPVTAGTDYLKNIVQTSPGSWQSAMAAAMLEGDTPDQAYAKVAVDFKGSLPKDPSTGDVDTKGVMKFGQDAWEGYLKDKAGTAESTPWQKAGLYDPSMRFTPEMMDSSITGGQQKAAASQATSQNKNALRDQESQRIAMQRMLAPPAHATPALQASVSAQRGGPQPAPLHAGNLPANATLSTPDWFANNLTGTLTPNAIGLPMPGGAPATPPVDLGALLGGHTPGRAPVPASTNYGMTTAAAAAQKAAMQSSKDVRGSALATMKAQAAAGDARNTYGSPTMMQIAKRLGFLQG